MPEPAQDGVTSRVPMIAPNPEAARFGCLNNIGAYLCNSGDCLTSALGGNPSRWLSVQPIIIQCKMHISDRTLAEFALRDKGKHRCHSS